MILLSAPSFSRPMPKYNPLSGQLEKTWGILMPKFCSQKIHKENFKNLLTFESRCGIIYTQDKERLRTAERENKMKATIYKVNGRTIEIDENGRIKNNKINRKILERNALDVLTMDDNADFEECLERVESASIRELIQIIAE